MCQPEICLFCAWRGLCALDGDARGWWRCDDQGRLSLKEEIEKYVKLRPQHSLKLNISSPRHDHEHCSARPSTRSKLMSSIECDIFNIKHGSDLMKRHISRRLPCDAIPESTLNIGKEKVKRRRGSQPSSQLGASEIYPRFSSSTSPP